MKKAIAWVLCLATLFTLCTGSFAASVPQGGVLAMDDLSATECDTIYTTADGTYAMDVCTDDGEEYIPVGRLDISLADAESVQAALNHPGIAPEMKTHIQKRYDEAQQSGNTDAVLTVFSQELLPRTRTTEYITYKGIPMRTDVIKETNLSTPTQRVASGFLTSSAAKSVRDVALSALGLTNSQKKLLAFVPKLSGSISLFLAFVEAGNSSYVTGSREDFLEASMRYNNTVQWTYASVGGVWTMCAVTQCAEILELYSKQYYYNTTTYSGEEHITDRDLVDPKTNTGYLLKTPGYSAPYAKAYQCLNNPVEEWMSWTVYNTTFYF